MGQERNASYKSAVEPKASATPSLIKSSTSFSDSVYSAVNIRICHIDRMVTVIVTDRIRVTDDGRIGDIVCTGLISPRCKRNVVGGLYRAIFNIDSGDNIGNIDS